MGMLSLAGIVSGAGAGAGKSLRQAQTYLNWEMLQEERGKLELQRDERINERNIANENRHRGQARADRLETQSDEYINAEADAAARFEQAARKARGDLRLGAEDEAIAVGKSKQKVADTLRPGIHAGAMADAENQVKMTEMVKSRSVDQMVNDLKDPRYKILRDGLRDQIIERREYNDGQSLARAAEYEERPELKAAFDAERNFTMTESQFYALEDLKFKYEHRDEDRVAANQKRLADMTDREQNKIGHLLTASERALQDLTKSISAAVDPAEKTLLQARYGEELQLNKDISAKARKIYGLRPARTAPVIGGPPVAHDASDASMEATVPGYSRGILGSTANK